MYLIQLVDALFSAYSFLILARVVMSWVDASPYNPIVQLIHNLTEPVLRPLRVLIPTGSMAIDISPILAFFILSFLKKIIIGMLVSMSPAGM